MTGIRSFSLGAAALAMIGAGLANPSLAGVLYVGGGKKIGAFKVEKQESFKGLNQVVIGQFTIAFFTKKVDYDGGGGWGDPDAAAKAIGNLTGVPASEYQRITDAAYTDFLAQLAAHGITVVDPAGLTANKYHAKVKPEQQGETVDIVLKKEDHADAVAFWPTQLGGRNINALVPMRMMDMGMGHAFTAQYDYARTAKIPVLNIIYFVDFAKPAKSTAGGLLQSVKVTAGLSVTPFGTQIGLVDTNGKMAKLMLNELVEESGEFANIVETTSAVTKVTQTTGAVGRVFGGFGGKIGGFGKLAGKVGGGTMNAKFEYQVTAPAVYGDKAISATKRTSDLALRLIDELK